MSDSHSTEDRSQRIEQIVAYLDGELSPQESAQVERRLAADEAFRQDLQNMERAWSALDELPKVTVDDKFSKTTMEMVVQVAGTEVEGMTMALPVQASKRRLSTIMLAIGACLLGLLVARLIWQDPNQDLVADLPVIEYVDIYFQVPDVEFLRKLNHVFEGSTEEHTVEENVDRVAQFQLVNSADNRDAWLDQLGDQQRIALRAKFNRFEAMSQQQQDRMRQLHEDIVADPQSDTLQQTLLLYQQWLQGLEASKQYDLRELSEPERLREIKRMVELEAKDRALELTEEELRKFRREVGPPLQEIVRDAVRQMADSGDFNASRRRRSNQFLLFLINAPPQHQEALKQAVVTALPPEKLVVFQKLPKPVQFRRIASWMWEEKDKPRRKSRRDAPSEQELEAFFVDEVDSTVQERLLAMPRDKMQAELKRMYRDEFASPDWQMFEGIRDRERGMFPLGPRGEGASGPGSMGRGRKLGPGQEGTPGDPDRPRFRGEGRFRPDGPPGFGPRRGEPRREGREGGPPPRPREEREVEADQE